MRVVDFIKTLYSFPSRKLQLWKAEQAERQLTDRYGSLTKYRLKRNNVEVGEFTYGIPVIIEYGTGWKLKIGKFCSISNNVEIIFGGQHHYEHISSYAFIPQVKAIFSNFNYEDKPVKDVVIGNDVWIGRNVTILQGVTIGDGAVIGTGTVVAKDVPPYAIVVGNPCKILKYRFSAEQITQLLQIKWWNWPIEKIKENISLIMSDQIDKFIELYNPINNE